MEKTFFRQHKGEDGGITRALYIDKSVQFSYEINGSM